MTTLLPEAEFYLHENGNVIYKPHGGVDASSPFVRRVWNANVVGKTPGIFADWLRELYNMGANKTRICQLAETNHLFEFIPELKEEFERLEIV